MGWDGFGWDGMGWDVTGWDEMGLVLVGEKRTHEIHSEWPSSWMVYLQTPRVFHSLMVRSREPDTICLLSAENATLRTSFVWPTNLLVVVPIVRSQRRRVESHEPDKANCPSEDSTMSDTKCPCPLRALCGTP